MQEWSDLSGYLASEDASSSWGRLALEPPTTNGSPKDAQLFTFRSTSVSYFFLPCCSPTSQALQGQFQVERRKLERATCSSPGITWKSTGEGSLYIAWAKQALRIAPNHLAPEGLGSAKMGCSRKYVTLGVPIMMQNYHLYFVLGTEDTN